MDDPDLKREASKLYATNGTGVMRATLGRNGMTVAPMPTDEGAALRAVVGDAIEHSIAEPRTEPAEPLVEDEQDLVDQRTAALEEAFREHREEARALERQQVVESIVAYANDCGKRAEELRANARKAFDSDEVVDAEAARAIVEDAEKRAKAFRVRQAILADVASKVAHGWGRNPDGSAQ